MKTAIISLAMLCIYSLWKPSIRYHTDDSSYNFNQLCRIQSWLRGQEIDLPEESNNIYCMEWLQSGSLSQAECHSGQCWDLLSLMCASTTYKQDTSLRHKSRWQGPHHSPVRNHPKWPWQDYSFVWKIVHVHFSWHVIPKIVTFRQHADETFAASRNWISGSLSAII